GHHDIHEDQVRVFGRRHLERLLPVARGDQVVRLLPQDHQDHEERGLGVVDDQDLFLARHHIPPPRCQRYAPGGGARVLPYVFSASKAFKSGEFRPGAVMRITLRRSRCEKCRPETEKWLLAAHTSRTDRGGRPSSFRAAACRKWTRRREGAREPEMSAAPNAPADDC